jgi:N-acetyl-anhydromuramyl-L-alanine amidase AmpD
MKIANDGWLVDGATPITHKKAFCQGGALKPENVKFILAHWTGGSSLDSAVGWLTSENAKASAHFVIGRDGKIAQLVAVGQVAWHAGVSHYECDFLPSNGPPPYGRLTFEKLNRYSIGLEFVNLGRLKRTEAGTFLSSTGRVVPPEDAIKSDDGRFYQTYTHEQLKSGLDLMLAIKEKFPTVFDVIGHMDVAPARKIDPGPEFPFAYYRGKVFGARGGDDAEDDSVVVA